MASNFNCVPCQIECDSRKAQLAHLRSDFHTYNLKRRVAGLTTVNEEEYEVRIKLLGLLDPNESDKVTKKVAPPRKRDRLAKQGKYVSKVQNLTDRQAGSGDVAQRQVALPLLSEAERDVESKGRQRKAEGESGTGSSPTVVPAEKKKAAEFKLPWDLTRSLFCTHAASSFEDNMAFMEKHYSFTIKDRKYLVDLKEFIDYLGQKVYEGHQCLYCNRAFDSLSAVWQHMDAKGHRLIGYHLDEHVEEYESFYDFRDSYKELNLPAAVKEQLAIRLDGGNRALCASTQAKDGGEGGDEDDEWEVIEEYEEPDHVFSQKTENPDDDEDEEDEEDEGDADEDAESGDAGSDAEEMSWKEHLLKMGVQLPYITERGNLSLPQMGSEVVHRKGLRAHRVENAMSRTGGFEAQLTRLKAQRTKYLALDNKEHSASNPSPTEYPEKDRHLMRKADASEAKHRVRLGVKTNQLNRAIARQNMIYI